MSEIRIPPAAITEVQFEARRNRSYLKKRLDDEHRKNKIMRELKPVSIPLDKCRNGF